MSQHDLTVRLRPPYPIRFRADFDRAFAALTQDHGDRDRFVVVDQRVLDHHPRALRRVGRTRAVVALPGGEACKTMRTWERLHAAAVAAGLDRDGLVVAVGGGSVGDVAGFFAATYLRGVDWCPVATTVLAMADSATGGKTAVNLQRAKNMVGAFHQPCGVYGAISALRTNPPRHLRSGLAEVVKSAMIARPRLFARLEGLAPRRPDRWNDEEWMELVAGAAAVKARVVQRDPTEKGPRALLNFGHTVGHAIEATRTPRPLHGAAVALGMVAATSISQRRGLVDDQVQARLESLLLGLGLKTRDARLDPTAVLDAIALDKKSVKGRARMVLTEGLGLASFGHQVERRELRRAIQLLTDRPR